jgi:hypothetical protein
METNWYSLNPIFAGVFPTFRPGKEAIDLKGKDGRLPDGIIQPGEILESINDTGNDETMIDNQDIVYFIKENIPEDKIKALTPLLFDYIQQNPMGVFYDNESSGSEMELLGVILANHPEYLVQAEDLLSSSNFLIRWAALDVLCATRIKTDSLREKVNILYAREQDKKIANETPNIKITYYQVNELYNNYLEELKYLVDFLNE